MTVAQLREALAPLDPDTLVYVWDFGAGGLVNDLEIESYYGGLGVVIQPLGGQPDAD